MLSSLGWIPSGFCSSPPCCCKLSNVANFQQPFYKPKLLGLRAKYPLKWMCNLGL
jgi:hypothetical protein